MAKTRINRVKGNKDYLVLAVVLFLVCVWCLHDGWFPGLFGKSTLKKHPKRMEIAFKIEGVIKDIPVSVGDKFEGEAVLAALVDEKYKERFEVARHKYEVAVEEKRADMSEKRDIMMKCNDDLQSCVIKNTSIPVKKSGEKSYLKEGEVIEVMQEVASHVEVMKSDIAGEIAEITEDAIYISPKGEKQTKKYQLDGMAPIVRDGDKVKSGQVLAGTAVIAVKPGDSFYLFNKSAAVLSFVAALCCLYFHWKVSQ